MNDLAINQADGDIVVTNGELQTVDGDAHLSQFIRTRLLTFLGEWFLDQRVGVPYFRDVLVKNPNPTVLRAVLRKVVANTPGVVQIIAFSTVLESTDRTLSVDFEVLTDTGSIVPGSFTELIL